MSLNNCLILFLCPSLLFDIRIQMIMPSLAALFTNPSRQIFGNKTPIFRPMLLYKSHYKFILLFSLDNIYITQGPLINFGLRTFCQRCRHCTSVLSQKKPAILFQFLAPNSSTSCLSLSSYSGVHHLFFRADRSCCPCWQSINDIFSRIWSTKFLFSFEEEQSSEESSSSFLKNEIAVLR